MSHKVAIYRKAHFNAAHRLNNPKLSPEQNEKIFGPCNNYNYHGHNYELEVKVTGEIDPITGYVMDIKDLADLIKSEVENRFDHKNLNLDTIEFKDLMPSAENIAIVIYDLLKAKIDSKFDLRIKLWETPRNYVAYPA